VATRLDSFAGDVARETIGATMPRIEAVFHDWYRNGGSLKAVETKVTAICETFEPEAAALVTGAWRALDADLLRIFRDHLHDFLRAHEIARDVSRYVPESAGMVSLSGVHDGTGDRIAAELAGFAGIMTTVAAGIGTLVVAAVNLHVVLLLAVAHPVLALVASIGALGSWLGLGSAVGTAVETAIREHEFNTVSRTMLHVALSETRLKEKLAEGRTAAQETVQQKILESLDQAGGKDGIVAGATRAFDAMIGQAVADLGVLEELERVSRPAEKTVPASEPV
jgi:hypothetical protein